jgi:hypothetical protein
MSIGSESEVSDERGSQGQHATPIEMSDRIVLRADVFRPVGESAIESAGGTLTLREPDRRAQIESMLEDRERAEVCHFTASHCQTRALKLKPWEIAPCDLLPSDNPGDHGVAAARELRDRLLDAALSRFEPDPMGALERHAKQG